MATLSEAQRLALRTFIQQIVGPTPNLELDGRFIPHIIDYNWEPQYVWFSPCGGAIVTIMLLFEAGNMHDGHYAALVCPRHLPINHCHIFRHLIHFFQCNCYASTHCYFLTPILPPQTRASIISYRALLERRQVTLLRRSERVRERVLYANLASSSEWGRLPPSEEQDESVVHYESETERTDPEPSSDESESSWEY